MKYPVQQGFTLVELLVALSIMAMMTFMSWKGIDAMRDTQQRLSQHNQEALALQSGLNQWELDLNNIYKHPFNPTLEWNGKAVRIVRNSQDHKSLQVVAWSTRRINTTNTWLRWASDPITTVEALNLEWQRAEHWSQSPTTQENDQKHETSIMPVSDMTIYYYWNNAWSNPFSSKDVAFANISAALGRAKDVPGEVPDAIRLVLSVDPTTAISGNLVKDWISPSVIGKTE